MLHIAVQTHAAVMFLAVHITCLDRFDWTVVQGPDWSALPEQQKRIASGRASNVSDAASADAAASNYLWTPDAADCAMDSDSRPESTRSATSGYPCYTRFMTQLTHTGNETQLVGVLQVMCAYSCAVCQVQRSMMW